MSTSALNIANYVLSLLDVEAGDSITNLKLQKILYYIQGHYLANFDKPLFDEKIEAWEYGPVVPEVYQEFKEYVNKCIPTDNLKFDLSALTEQERTFVNKIFSIYNDFSASSLVTMTHKDNTPWKNTYKKYQNNEINQEQIKIFFEKQMEDVFLEQVKELLNAEGFNNVSSWEEYKFSND